MHFCEIVLTIVSQTNDLAFSFKMLGLKLDLEKKQRKVKLKINTSKVSLSFIDSMQTLLIVLPRELVQMKNISILSLINY